MKENNFDDLVEDEVVDPLENFDDLVEDDIDSNQPTERTTRFDHTIYTQKPPHLVKVRNRKRNKLAKASRKRNRK